MIVENYFGRKFPAANATENLSAQISQDRNLGVLGIDSRPCSFVRREHRYLANLTETLNAKSTVSPYFGEKDFAFALA